MMISFIVHTLYLISGVKANHNTSSLEKDNMRSDKVTIKALDEEVMDTNVFGNYINRLSNQLCYEKSYWDRHINFPFAVSFYKKPWNYTIPNCPRSTRVINYTINYLKQLWIYPII